VKTKPETKNQFCTKSPSFVIFSLSNGCVKLAVSRYVSVDILNDYTGISEQHNDKLAIQFHAIN